MEILNTDIHPVILFWSSDWLIIWTCNEAGSFPFPAEYTDECEHCSKLDGRDDGIWERSLAPLAARENVYTRSWVTRPLPMFNQEMW